MKSFLRELENSPAATGTWIHGPPMHSIAAVPTSKFSHSSLPSAIMRPTLTDNVILSDTSVADPIVDHSSLQQILIWLHGENFSNLFYRETNYRDGTNNNSLALRVGIHQWILR